MARIGPDFAGFRRGQMILCASNLGGGLPGRASRGTHRGGGNFLGGRTGRRWGGLAAYGSQRHRPVRVVSGTRLAGLERRDRRGASLAGAALTGASATPLGRGGGTGNGSRFWSVGWRHRRRGGRVWGGNLGACQFCRWDGLNRSFGWDRAWPRQSWRPCVFEAVLGKRSRGFETTARGLARRARFRAGRSFRSFDSGNGIGGDRIVRGRTRCLGTAAGGSRSRAGDLVAAGLRQGVAACVLWASAQGCLRAADAFWTIVEGGWRAAGAFGTTAGGGWRAAGAFGTTAEGRRRAP